MKTEVVSALFDWDHARTILGVVREAGVDAILVSRTESDVIPEWASDDAVCVLSVPEGQKDRAEVATHKFYDLCRWCGRQLKGQVVGECPDCGTPIDPYAAPDLPPHAQG